MGNFNSVAHIIGILNKYLPPNETGDISAEHDEVFFHGGEYVHPSKMTNSDIELLETYGAVWHEDLGSWQKYV